jgi:hypothetical protein
VNNLVVAGSLDEALNDDNPAEIAHSNNFTIPLMEFAWLLSVMVLCMAYYRFSARYELFTFSHYLMILFFSLSFLHSYQSWFFTGGSLLIYVTDKCIRFVRSTRYHKITLLNYYGDAKVTRVQVSGDALSNAFNNNFLGNKLAAGMFCWINIPEVSPYEWHPYSISSPPYMAFAGVSGAERSGVVEFSCLECGSADSWTRRLAALAERRAFEEIAYRKSQGLDTRTAGNKVSDDFGREIREESEVYLRANTKLNSGGLAEIPTLNRNTVSVLRTELSIGIDGPYGRCIDFSRRNNLLLIAGGIGITPLMSIYSEIAARKRNTQKFGDVGTLNHVHLVWIVRDASIFSAFSHIIDAFLNDTIPRNMSFQVFETHSLRPSQAAATSGPGNGNGNDPAAGGGATVFDATVEKLSGVGRGQSTGIELGNSFSLSAVLARSRGGRTNRNTTGTTGTNEDFDYDGDDPEAQGEDSMVSRDRDTQSSAAGMYEQRDSSVVNVIMSVAEPGKDRNTTTGRNTAGTTGNIDLNNANVRPSGGPNPNQNPNQNFENASSQQLFSVSLGRGSNFGRGTGQFGPNGLFQLQSGRPDLDAVFSKFRDLVRPSAKDDDELSSRTSDYGGRTGLWRSLLPGDGNMDVSCIACGPKCLQSNVSDLCFKYSFEFQSEEFLI